MALLVPEAFRFMVDTFDPECVIEKSTLGDPKIL
jgi:hypothetical protein